MTVAPNDAAALRAQEVLTELFGPLSVRVRGRERPTVYLHLLSSLIVLRHRDRPAWSRLRDDVRRALDEQWAPQKLLRTIGHRVAGALESAGLPPGPAVRLDDLDAEAVDDVAHIVRLCEELGVDAFHQLLDRFQTWSKPTDEAFFTPRSVVETMVDLLLKDGDATGRFHDPFLGGGEFLAGAMEVSPSLRLSGTGPSRDLLEIAGMRLHALGIPQADLSVAPQPHPSASPTSQAHFVLSNPPFNSRRHGRHEEPDKDWAYGPPPTHNDNYAWLQHILVTLAPGGRAGVLMPNRAAVSTDARELNIRSRMIKDGAVECVIALPRQLFAGTAAPAMIWVLRRPTSRGAAPTGRILLIDARRFGTKDGKQRVLSRDEINALVECVHRWRSGNESFPDAMDGRGGAAAVPIAEIAEHGYSLAPSDHVPETPPSPVRETWMQVPRPAAALEFQAEQARAADERVAHISVAHRTLDKRDRVSDRRDVRLADLCRIQAGPSHSLVKKAERAVNGVPLVMPAHLQDHRISAEDAVLLSARSAHTLQKYQIRQGDILIVRTGSVGPTALVTAAEEGWLPSTNLMRVRPDDGVDPGYLLALLSSPTVQNWIEARSGAASAIPSISAANLGMLPVKLPPPDEQRRIGLTVDALDTQITAHHALARAAETARAALADGLVNGLLATVHPLKEES
ncbi:N-6 DNA methylase [Actinomadura sp. 3N407]|uniref:N-6 DNA methylase n=1 Tax=Actinomadura sp. 3N407 TaxID=3457423 RepID=UPI003FCD6DE3